MSSFVVAAVGEHHVRTLLMWLAMLSLVVWAAVHVIGKIRTKPAQQELTANELISKFRELHSRGELSDAEFRTIKTTLAARLREEIKGKDESG